MPWRTSSRRRCRAAPRAAPRAARRPPTALLVWPLTAPRRRHAAPMRRQVDKAGKFHMIDYVVAATQYMTFHNIMATAEPNPDPRPHVTTAVRALCRPRVPPARASPRAELHAGHRNLPSPTPHPRLPSGRVPARAPRPVGVVEGLQAEQGRRGPRRSRPRPHRVLRNRPLTWRAVSAAPSGPASESSAAADRAERRARSTQPAGRACMGGWGGSTAGLARQEARRQSTAAPLSPTEVPALAARMLLPGSRAVEDVRCAARPHPRPPGMAIVVHGRQPTSAGIARAVL